MNKRFALLLAVAAVSCADGPTLPAGGDRITLSATQAAALQEQIGGFAGLHADLAWLADSVSLVLRSGAVAERVAIDSDLAEGPFYGVGLQRVVCGAGCSSTFHLIAFNDAEHPTAFVMASGWTMALASSISGPIGPGMSSQLSVYVFGLDEAGVTSWAGDAGTVSLATGATGAACTGVALPEFVTCEAASLVSAFDVTLTRQFGATGPMSGTAALASSTTSGIRLHFQFP